MSSNSRSASNTMAKRGLTFVADRKWVLAVLEQVVLIVVFPQVVYCRDNKIVI